MQLFLETIEALDQARTDSVRRQILSHHFTRVSPEDFPWSVYLLTGRMKKRLLNGRQFQDRVCRWTGIESWLFERCLAESGDLAETAALLFPDPAAIYQGDLADWMTNVLLPLEDLSGEERFQRVFQALHELCPSGRYLLLRILLGRFRAPVDVAILQDVLADLGGVAVSTLSRRLAVDWIPSAGFQEGLFAPAEPDEELLQPVPFKPLTLFHGDAERESLGDLRDWWGESCLAGIRCQAIHGEGEVLFWSESQQDLLTQFPDCSDWIRRLPRGTILEGVLQVIEGAPFPSGPRQARGRGKLASTRFVAFDLHRHRGIDVRHLPLRRRIQLLKEVQAELDSAVCEMRPKVQRTLFESGSEQSPDVATNPVMEVIERFEFRSWSDVERRWRLTAEQSAAGLILKHCEGSYAENSGLHAWRLWRPQLRTVTSVLIYVEESDRHQQGTKLELTFALWKQHELIPVARLPSHLSDDENAAIREFAREHTERKFGPVRAVKPLMVFELGFRGIATGEKKKSGLQLKGARILRWLPDSVASEADALDTLLKMHNPP